jgi:hypothetical protein
MSCNRITLPLQAEAFDLLLLLRLVGSTPGSFDQSLQIMSMRRISLFGLEGIPAYVALNLVNTALVPDLGLRGAKPDPN